MSRCPDRDAGTGRAGEEAARVGRDVRHGLQRAGALNSIKFY